MSQQTSRRLDRYLERAAGDLPTLPAIAANVIRVSEDPSTTPADLVQLIERDPGIAGRILQVSNSSLYGFPSKIQGLGHAITLLGFRAVRNLALAASMKQTYKEFSQMEKLLWEHAAMAGPVTAAVVTHLHLPIDSDDAFTAGLMHDIGKTALANSHRDKYEKVVESAYNDRVSFADAEHEQFGFDHAELGGAVAERWNLPPILATMIRMHHCHDGFDGLPERQAMMVAAVALSTACLTRLGVGRDQPAEALDLSALPSSRFLDIDKEATETLLDVCRKTLEAAKVLIE